MHQTWQTQSVLTKRDRIASKKIISLVILPKFPAAIKVIPEGPYYFYSVKLCFLNNINIFSAILNFRFSLFWTKLGYFTEKNTENSGNFAAGKFRKIARIFFFWLVVVVYSLFIQVNSFNTNVLVSQEALIKLL